MRARLSDHGYCYFMEARVTYWHETKTKKYHDLANQIAEKGLTVRFFALEVGLVGKSF
jgi:hypothetical protein